MCEFLYFLNSLVSGPKEASVLKKNPARSVLSVSIQHWVEPDKETDRHRTTDNTALA